MIKDKRATPFHREFQLRGLFLGEKHSVQRRPLRTLAWPPSAGRTAILEHFRKIRLCDPVRHGLVFRRSCAPFGVPPSAARRRRVEVTQNCHPVALRPSLRRQIVQRSQDYCTGCSV